MQTDIKKAKQEKNKIYDVYHVEVIIAVNQKYF